MPAAPNLARRALALFEAALDVPLQERPRYVRERTTEDPRLRARVLRLLRADAAPPAVLRGSLATHAVGALGVEPRRLGRYLLGDCLGRGGMGAVFLARDEILGRDVAVKLLNGMAGDEAAQQRLLAEARAASAIDDPRICAVHDVGIEADGRAWIVMAYCPGETLRQRLGRGPLPPVEALAIARDVARGVSAAHARGIIHRDIKPGNIMLTAAGVKLLDFGIADTGGARLTREHGVMGTLSYMSPERVAGGRGDARADVWSLGAVLFEMLTGSRAFDGDHDAQIMHAVLNQPPPALRSIRPDLPATAESTVLRMLEKDPALRYPTMREALQALEDTASVLADAAALSVTGAGADNATGSPAVGGAGASVNASKPARAAAMAFPHTLRTARRKWMAGVALPAAAVVVIGIGAAMVTARAPGPQPGDGAGAAGLLDTRAVVLPFTNQTGLDSLHVVAEWAAEWVGLELMPAGVISVVPASAARAAAQRILATGSVPEPELAGEVAREFGARIAVVGSVFREGDRLEFHARIFDASRGELLRALEPVDGTIARPSLGFPALRARAVSAIAAVSGSDFAAFTALQSQPPTYQAYQEFSRGSALFADSRYLEAVPYFERAAELDPSYTLPLVYLALSHGNSGQIRFVEGRIEPVDSILNRVEARRASLPLYDLNFLEFARAVSTPHPDWERALAAARELHRIAPGARTDYDVGANLVRLNRPRAAVAFFNTLDPERGELRGWMPYWYMLARAYHMIGDHAAEEETAVRARRQQPRAGVALAIHLRALTAQGRTGHVVAMVDSALATPRLGGSMDGSHVAEEALLELMAHGHRDAAAQVHHRLVAWLERRRLQVPDDAEVLEDLLFAHVAAEAWPAALDLLPAVLAQRPDDPLILGLEGVVMARTGRVEAALERSARLAMEEGVYDMGRRVTSSRSDLHPRRWAAEVAAAAGDADRAVALLRRAHAEGLRHGPWQHVAPGLRYLRGNAAFEALLEPAG